MTARREWGLTLVLLASGCGQDLSDQSRQPAGAPVEGSLKVAPDHEENLIDGSILVTGGWSAALDAVRLIRNRGSISALQSQLSQIQATQQQILAEIDALEQQVRVNAIGDVVSRVSTTFQPAVWGEQALAYYLVNPSGNQGYLATAQADTFNAAQGLAESDQSGTPSYGYYWFPFNGQVVFSPLFASNHWMFALAARLDTLYAGDPNTATNAKSELCGYVPQISRLADLTQQWIDAQVGSCFIDIENDCGAGVKPTQCIFTGAVSCPNPPGWPFLNWPTVVASVTAKGYYATQNAASAALAQYHQSTLPSQWGVGEMRSVASELYNLATCNVWYY